MVSETIIGSGCRQLHEKLQGIIWACDDFWGFKGHIEIDSGENPTDCKFMIITYYI